MTDVTKTLRIVVADDSAVVRHMLTMLFDSAAKHAHDAPVSIELCGTASDGVSCVELVRAMRPDLVLLDLEMPRMCGMEVLDVLHREFPNMPTVICSAYTECAVAKTLEALAHGADDYVTKPSGSADPMAAVAALSAQLLPKIAALVQRAHSQPNAVVQHLQEIAVDMPPLASAEIVGIGASTGGPSALEMLLPRLPTTLQAPVVIVQHLPKLFTSELALRLDRSCSMPVRVAEHGTILRPGTIWFAPSDIHMEIVKDAGRVAHVLLLQGPPVHQSRPAVDHLFRSMAHGFGARALGVVLTGMGADGLAGARALVHAGGSVLVQDEKSSAVWGMPGRVAEAGLAAAILPLSAMATEIITRVADPVHRAMMSPLMQTEAAYATP